MPARISRSDYASMYGPTTGDRVRLADTELFIEVERDHTTYGNEVKFGGGKVIRDGMGQSQLGRAAGAVDTVITNALIVDFTARTRPSGWPSTPAKSPTVPWLTTFPSSRWPTLKTASRRKRSASWKRRSRWLLRREMWRMRRI